VLGTVSLGGVSNAQREIGGVAMAVSNLGRCRLERGAEWAMVSAVEPGTLPGRAALKGFRGIVRRSSTGSSSRMT
jgi:hypothetical protein